MSDAELEKLLAEGNTDLVSPTVLERVAKREYPFVVRYLHAKDPYVRELAVTFLREMKQRWCYPLDLELLGDDLESVRAAAAEGIMDLAPDGEAARLTEEIVRQRKRRDTEGDATLRHLTLAVGKIGDSQAAEGLRRALPRPLSPDLSEALSVALAKLGDATALRAVEKDLESEDARTLAKALRNVEYLGGERWKPKLRLLLLNESVAIRQEMGEGRAPLRIRVCDLTADVLKKIDPSAAIEFERSPYRPYSDEQMREIRKRYGAGAPSK
jgi:HEAT repeat protein